MNEYRKTVKGRLVLLIVCALISFAAVFAGFKLTAQAETPTSTFADGFTKGFPLGLFAAFCALILVSIVRHIRALAGEGALKKMYISENDERKKLIRQSALGKSFFFTAGALVVGIAVASFYNSIVTLTLMAVLSLHALAGAALKIYYLAKY